MCALGVFQQHQIMCNSSKWNYEYSKLKGVVKKLGQMEVQELN
jgi:hypothetical protein